MQLFLSPRKQNAGFSIVELIAALAVLMILCALIFGAVGKMRDQSRLSRDLQTMRGIGSVLHLYIAENRGVLPQNQQPVPIKTPANYLGYTQRAEDWSNDAATPRNSIFRNGADETAIRQTFVSALDPRQPADPLNGFAFNSSMGLNPASDPERYSAETNVRTFLEIARPAEKIYLVPSWYMPAPETRFSEATTTSPFRTPRNPANKGDFPALFADGHIAMVNPAPEGMILNQINLRWVRPKAP